MLTAKTLVVAIAFMCGLSAGCKKEKAEDDLSALIQSDPKKAIEVLEQKYNDDPNDYAAVRGLAQAFAALDPPKWERAAAWYRKAIDMPQGQGKDERRVLFDELLKCVENQIVAGRAAKIDQKKMVEMLQAANKLEQALARQNIKAGKELFDLAKADFDAKVEGRRYADAIAVIGGLSKIYVDEKTRETLTSQLPKVQGLKFEQDTLVIFIKSVKGPLVEKGLFDDEQKAFTFTGRHSFVEPEPPPAPEPAKRGDPPPEPPPRTGPDPATDGFGKLMETAACGEAVVLPKLKAVLSPFAKASPLGRELTDVEVKPFFEILLKTRKTRWEGEAWDKTKQVAPGTRLEIVCDDSLALSVVIRTFRELKK